MKKKFKIIRSITKLIKQIIEFNSQLDVDKKEVPSFRVVNVQKLTPPALQPGDFHAPSAWGPRVSRPSHVSVFFNQQKCIVCQESIHFSFQNKGWARCPVSKKLIHGHCYEAWSDAKGSGCAVCGMNTHTMKKISYL